MKGYRVLFVDDDKQMLETIKEFFELLNTNVKVDIESSPDKVLDRLSENEYSIVFLDLKMPKINGMELLKKIKSIYPEIIIIILSGYATVELTVEALKLGAHDVLLKPIDLQQLKDKIFEVLNIIEKTEEETKLQQNIRLYKYLIEFYDEIIKISDIRVMFSFLMDKILEYLKDVYIIGYCKDIFGHIHIFYKGFFSANIEEIYESIEKIGIKKSSCINIENFSPIRDIGKKLNYKLIYSYDIKDISTPEDTIGAIGIFAKEDKIILKKKEYIEKLIDIFSNVFYKYKEFINYILYYQKLIIDNNSSEYLFKVLLDKDGKLFYYNNKYKDVYEKFLKDFDIKELTEKNLTYIIEDFSFNDARYKVLINKTMVDNFHSYIELYFIKL